MARSLPQGTVTFLFTDVEGSTKLLRELGAELYADALEAHRRVVRAAFAEHGGVEVDTQGDAFFYAFSAASAAVAAADAARTALERGPIRVRIGLHTGVPHLAADGYVGEDVHLGARIAAAAHGGQVVLSGATRAHLEDELTDLGEHRLKDFEEPVWLYQLGDARFPPLRTISNTNLPRPASSFVGRTRELAELTRAVRERSRLVTLTGPGGSGKTRLALEAAAELVPEFRNGVFWIPLAAVRDAGLVTAEIARTLGAQQGLAEHVGERELLLLLDNVEQVVESAPELATLVERCPNLRVLVTSREVLRVRGELEFPLPPLANAEAVDLFCARTQLEPEEAVVELCRRLDDLPLAVELAAARARVLTAAQILERLSHRLDLLRGGRDAEARQQTLRSTIDWSYELLGDDERRLFAQLSIFRGGCTLAAAETVCGADLDALQSLVEKSVVRHTGDRFWMLEVIREYAQERFLALPDVAELQARFVDHFAALALEAASPLPEGAGDPLEHELDNLRAALDWLELSGDTQRALSVLFATAEFWSRQIRSGEALRRLVRVLEADPAGTVARARALGVAALHAVDTGRSDLGLRLANEGLSLSRELGDDESAAQALFGLGMCAVYTDWERALDCFAESQSLFRRVGDRRLALEVGMRLAWAHQQLGDRAAAQRMHEAQLQEARASGNRDVEARTLSTLSRFAVWDGRLDDAAELNAQALQLHLERGLRWGVVLDLSTAARLLALAGRHERAARLLGSVERQEAELELSESWLTEFNEETRALLRNKLGGATLLEELAAGRRLTIDEGIALASGGAS